ncbi:MAG: cytochrome c [Betaproteobacteria bacterium]
MIHLRTTSILHRSIYLAALAVGLSALPAWAGGDAAAGAKKADTCAACHGPGGGKPLTADYPMLAGQHEDYIKHSLAAYKSGKRKNAIMNGMAAALSKEDIADLAAYFSEQTGLQDKY